MQARSFRAGSAAQQGGLTSIPWQGTAYGDDQRQRAGIGDSGRNCGGGCDAVFMVLRSHDGLAPRQRQQRNSGTINWEWSDESAIAQNGSR